jgi:hypothetical protein
VSQAEAPRLDVPRILGSLRRHRVDFVVIGAIAAIAQGYPLPTQDLDVTPDPRPDNLERLAASIRELEAKLRTPRGAVEFPIDAQMLSGNTVWSLTTAAGDFDLVFEPAGTQGYGDLRRQALLLDLGGGEVPVATLADVIRSKEAAGRIKDEAQLPALRQTLDVIREREREAKS